MKSLQVGRPSDLGSDNLTVSLFVVCFFLDRVALASLKLALSLDCWD